MNHWLLTACLFLAMLSSRDCWNAQHTSFIFGREAEILNATRKKKMPGFKTSSLLRGARKRWEKRVGLWAISLGHMNNPVNVNISTSSLKDCPH